MNATVENLQEQLATVNAQIRNKYLKQLRESTCRVTFVKQDGTERVMECTLVEGQIPAEMTPKSDGNVTKVNESVIKAFDVEKQGWRSFRVDSVKDFVAV